MVLKCAVPGCPNREKSTTVRKSVLAMSKDERLTFHVFPLQDSERLKLWLLAIRRDVNFPIRYVKQMKLCSEHFSPDDFRPCPGTLRRLKRTAVPNQFLHNAQETLNAQLSHMSEGSTQNPQSADPLQPNQDPCPADSPPTSQSTQATDTCENTPIIDPDHKPRATVDHSLLLTFGISPGAKKRTQTPEGTRAKIENDRCHAKMRIDIGRAFPLWRKVREQMGFKSDPEMAFFLLQRVCSESFSVQREREKPRKSTPVPAPQTEESESDQTHPSDEDEDMEASEICYEVPPACQTNESSQNRLKSEDQIKTEHQLMSEDQIKTEHQLMSEDQIKTEHQLMSEDQIKTEHQLMSEDQIKTEHQLMSEDQIKKTEDYLDKDICKVSVADIVPQSSTSSTTTKEEVKEEPVETELDNRLEVNMCPVVTSDKIDHNYVRTPNRVTVENREMHKEIPLVPKKSHLMGLFQTCLRCGGPVLEYTIASSGNQNHVKWKCSKGHLMWLFPNNKP